MNKFGIVLALALAAGAQAQVKQPGGGSLLSGVGGGGFNQRGAISYINYNVGGIQSWDSAGSALNYRASLNLGANTEIVALGWDVDLQTLLDPSWLSEPAVAFSSDAGTQVNLTPGIGDNFGGIGHYSSGGPVDLVGIGLNFTLGADGLLGLEFFEQYDDYFGEAEGLWAGGALTVGYIVVPTPGAFALFGVAGVMATRRRR